MRLVAPVRLGRSVKTNRMAAGNMDYRILTVQAELRSMKNRADTKLNIMTASQSATEQTMRIAVTTAGDNLDSEIDPRFGRAQFILVVNGDGTLLEVIDNAKNRAAAGGAGIQAAKTLADKNVDMVLTGRCGPNATEALKSAGIEFGKVQSGTAREVVERFNRGEISSVNNIGPGLNATGQGKGGGRGKGSGKGKGRRQSGDSGRWFG
jgi:predicted Fe-Mo cluster-binding NifX family protein